MTHDAKCVLRFLRWEESGEGEKPVSPGPMAWAHGMTELRRTGYVTLRDGHACLTEKVLEHV